MDIVKTQSEPILLTISRIEDQGTKAAVLYEHVKNTSTDLAEITTDHERFPTILKMVVELGKSVVKMFLVMLLENLVRSLNISQPAKEQILDIADDLITDHPTLKPQDFQIFFRNYKKGKYGADYQRFDTFNLNVALSKYLNERADYHEEALSRRKYVGEAKVKDTVDVRDIYAKMREDAEKEYQTRKSISARDKHRRAAADAYAAELQAWCDQNGKFIDDEAAVVEFASVKPFTMEYIDNFISKNFQNEL